MRSIQTRLLAGTVIGSTLVLSVSGIILYLLVRASLWTEFDDALAGRARTLAAMVEQEEGQVEFAVDNLNMPEFERTDRPEYLQLWQDNGKVLVRSGSLRGGDLERPNPPSGETLCRPTVLPDGRRGQLAAITFRPHPGNEDEGPPREAPSSAARVTLVIARDTADIDRTLTRLRALIASMSITAIVVSGGVLAWVVRGGLRPMQRLAHRIDQMGEADLATRIEVPDTPSELQPVIDRLNDLLHRLDAAFTREKTFTADVAHELRTPLAGLRSTLEVTLSRQRPPDAYRAAMQETLTITQQMQTMVHNLLALARIEAGQMRVAPRPVDLGAVLRDAWGTFTSRADERSLRVHWHDDRPSVAMTDREMIQQVVYNLLDNAVTYVEERGEIVIETDCRDGAAKVTITNTGGTLSPEDAQHLFERFWRADASRTNTGVHCGLGLSLSERIMSLLGGTITVESTPEGVFRAILTLATA
jgi:two-component system, OmpR family, heavy metal sensor histidine kinase CusS